ncbi:hypothetical protein F2P79_014149 [Pimephales promelas]|nr:hypothetical protein F2P79_014149 [Pimephales promelas]
MSCRKLTGCDVAVSSQNSVQERKKLTCNIKTIAFNTRVGAAFARNHNRSGDDDSQLCVGGVQKQVRPRRKDLNLYEEYKRSRTLSLRGRNTNRGIGTNRRRELEQTLPQALLADLVRERREKTRLRVARWRAKRKLQACLMASQAAQFNGVPVQSSPAQRGGLISSRRRGGVTAQRGGFGLRRGLSDAGTYNLLLQFGPSPTQSAPAHGINEGMMPSALSQNRPTYQ